MSVTDEQRRQILELASQGLKSAEISRKTGINRGTIMSVMAHRTMGKYENPVNNPHETDAIQTLQDSLESVLRLQRSWSAQNTEPPPERKSHRRRALLNLDIRRTQPPISKNSTEL